MEERGRRVYGTFDMGQEKEADPPKSYGNMSDQHWSKTRGERNAEAIDYYRQRSRAPGVKEGGEARNFYCMECDGVVPHDHEQATCPHCGAPLEGQVKRYFDEMYLPPRRGS